MPRVTTPLSTTAFLLSKVGQLANDRFAAKLAPLGVRPRHCGLLAAASAMTSCSQEDLSRALDLVPSAIVGIVDDLEQLGALRRVASAENRRRYSIELTAKGRTLLGACTRLAEALDEEILGGLTAAQRKALAQALGAIGSAHGAVAMRHAVEKHRAPGGRKGR